MDGNVLTTATATGLDYRTDLRSAIMEAKAHSSAARDTFHRIIVRVPGGDPLRWVGSIDHAHRMYWSGREREDVVAGVGRAAVVESDGAMDYSAIRSALNRYLSAAPSGTRFFGGIRFDDVRTESAEWKAFPTYRFVMPRFEMRVVYGATLVICNIGPDDDFDEVIAELDELRPSTSDLESSLPALASRTNFPDTNDWRRFVEWSLSAFSSTTLAKVVIARKARLLFDADLDASSLLERVKKNTPSCYHFAFCEDGSSFIGASPEMLFRQDGSAVRSEAVAGTAPRGDTDGADLEFEQRLRASEKDQREHEYVRQSIKEDLKDLTRVLHVDITASDMKLAQGRHLRSEVDGTLAEGVDAIDLLQALHPTPAVGGYPQDDAMDVIRHLEPFDRGWYAGPVGWIADGAAEFAVAIRSGLCRGNVLDLFSGAGIVSGSDAELEWQEVEQKISDFLRALGLDHRR